MKNFLIIFLSLCCALCSAQGLGDSTLDAFTMKVASSCLSFDYTFSAQTDVTVTGEGRAQVQGGSFYVEGNGLRIYCDGQSRWTLDDESMEAVAEDVQAGADDYLTDPALLLSSLDKSFKLIRSGTEVYAGKSCHTVSLAPSRKSELSSVRLYFDSARLAGVRVTLSIGTTTDFTLSNLIFSDKLPATHFTFDEKTLCKQWVVTDLR